MDHDVEVYTSDEEDYERVYETMTKPHHEQIRLENLTKILSSKRHSDLTVKCGTDTFQLHRAVVYKPGYFQYVLATGKTSAIPGLLVLEEKNQEHVIAMFIYLYTGEYTIPNFRNLQSENDRERTCDHDKVIHSCLNPKCYYSPYGFVVSMFYLGDKYSIPGLKAYSVTRLQELLDIDALKYWQHEMTVWEFAYQHSRSTDELRKLLIEYITKAPMGPRGRSLRWAAGLHAFIEHVPEKASALLKGCLKSKDPSSIEHVPEKAGASLKGFLKSMDPE